MANEVENAMTVKELLVAIKMSDSKLRELLKEGLPHFKVGSDYRFIYSKVIAYLEDKKK